MEFYLNRVPKIHVFNFQGLFIGIYPLANFWNKKTLRCKSGGFQSIKLLIW